MGRRDLRGREYEGGEVEGNMLPHCRTRIMHAATEGMWYLFRVVGVVSSNSREMPGTATAATSEDERAL